MTKLICVFLIAGTLFAETSWNALNQLKPGDRIQVTTRDHENVHGEFTATREDGITLRSKQGEQTFAKTSVKRVAIRDNSRRVRNLLIGAGIGVGVGIAIGSFFGTLANNETGPCPACYAVPPLVLGGLGALAGIPAGYRTIYKVK